MKKTKGILLTILSAIIFGFSFTLAPMTYGDGGSSPVTLTFLRSFICIPILFTILRVKNIPFTVTKKEFVKIVILGLMGSAATTLILNTSFAYIDVGIASTLHFVYPIFVTLGCIIFYKEKLSFAKLTALLIATAGICLFFSASSGSPSNNLPLGILLAIVSGVTYAFFIIFIDKSGLKDINPFTLSFYIAVVVSASIFIYGTISGKLTLSTLTPKSWLLTFTIAILCSVVAISLFQIGVKYIGASTAAILSLFEPITGVIFGSLILGEKLTCFKIIACVLIFTGVTILVLSRENTGETELKN